MFKLHRPRIINRFRKNEDGATAVEFAMVALPFFFLLVAILEASLHFFAGQMLENAVDNASREIRTGQFSRAGTISDFKDLLEANVAGFLNKDDMNIDVETALNFETLGGPPPLDEEGNIDKDAYKFNVPGRETIVMVTVTYEWPVITNFMQGIMSDLSNGNALLTAVAVFRTEPF